ncbi:hypothetical protein FSARC_11590 [Fusarium sarcochroum]|uniref:FAD-binding PCMH-type domain-containing protein n=1 Tax=Fusarium sarcochroum TaxID=1208366 RepID=A0A8H4WZB1_9HYPO|nr:hypothetical protein FSARC_11590 [Fusarium sarcochroum]
MTINSLISKLEADPALTKAKLYEPNSSDYKQVEQCFIQRPVQTLGIVKPQNADEVAAVVQFCIKNNVEFSVRSGGHDCAARTLVDGALVIDMRDINHVAISQDKRSAAVGGGILAGQLSKVLGEEGLATPVGTISTVGYTGWATLGGYGPLSSHYGLGVDQIIGARIVNAQGEIQTADEELLSGIRGGGGSLGIIVELTIKVYPMGKILNSTIVYESSDLDAAITSYTQHYEKLLLNDELPVHLQLQPAIMHMPGPGVVFAVIATWHGENLEEGRTWIKNIAGAGTCVMEATQETTVADMLEANEKLVTWPSYGRVFTLNVKKLTPKAITILAKHCPNAPGGALIFSYHTLRSVRDPVQKSIFGTTARHHMLEIYAVVPDPSVAEERMQWAAKVKAEIEKEDADNILESSYISLGSHEDVDLKKIYGRHYSTLMDLKKKHDPKNVFKHTVPRLLQLEDKKQIVEA